MKQRWLFSGVLFLALALGTIFVLQRSPRKSEEAAPISSQVSQEPQPVEQSSGPTGASFPQPALRRSELDQAIEALSNDSVLRTSQIAKLIEEMPAGERLKNLEQLWSEEAHGARRELAGELLRRWAQESPRAAAEWVAHKPEGPFQREASRSVAIGWANQNLSEAANWVRGWPEDQKETGLLAVAYEAVRTSPKDALWLASELKPTASRDSLITHAVREWAAQDPEAPLAWAEKMESSSLKDQVYASAALSLSETDPTAAANLAVEKVQPGGRQDDTVVSIVQRWAQSDPEHAADWVAKFPEGRMGNAAIENLVQIWAEKAPDKAREWLTGLAEGPLRDAGVAAYAHKLAVGQPQTALNWAAKITDADLRSREIESLAQMWLRSDHNAASKWVQNASVSEEIKSRLLKAP